MSKLTDIIIDERNSVFFDDVYFTQTELNHCAYDDVVSEPKEPDTRLEDFMFTDACGRP